MNFFETVRERQQTLNTTLCLGLDPRPEWFTPADEARSPKGNLWAQWGRRLIDATADYVCCVKPNAGFYEAGGTSALTGLQKTIEYAHQKGLPVLLDAKRGDIGSTAEAYAHAAFEWLRADAVTISPYLGEDTVAPFLAYERSGVFVLCHTSNPSAGDFQTLPTAGRALYEVVAEVASGWSDRVGLVVGAPYPEAIGTVRRIAPDAWLLLPGIGPQGGDPEAAVMAAGHNFIVPASRAIATATQPADAARVLRDTLRAARPPTSPKGKRGRQQHHHLDALILDLHRIGAVQFGDFTLASGKRSPIYIDLRLLAAEPAVLARAASAYVALLHDLLFDHIAAIPYAALPIGTAVALQSGRPLIYPRKEAKEYGRKRRIEGRFDAGDRAVLLDDLITTGGSKVEVARVLRDAGLTVEDVVVLIDRQATSPKVPEGESDLAAHGLRLHAALTLHEVVEVLAARGMISEEQTRNVREYLENNVIRDA